jgi:hypothetical protein
MTPAEPSKEDRHMKEESDKIAWELCRVMAIKHVQLGYVAEHLEPLLKSAVEAETAKLRSELITALDHLETVTLQRDVAEMKLSKGGEVSIDPNIPYPPGITVPANDTPSEAGTSSLRAQLTASLASAAKLRNCLRKIVEVQAWHNKMMVPPNPREYAIMANDTLHAESAPAPSESLVLVEKPPQWRGMESAPRDGTSILLHWKDADQDVRVGWYNDRKHAWWDAIQDYSIIPEAWLPLPAAPAPLSSEGNAK